MNKKIPGYSSVLFIIIIFLMALSLVFVGLVTNQNAILKKTMIDGYQGKYIAESYLNLFLSKLKDDSDLIIGENTLAENLFPDLDHSKSCQVFSDEIYFDQPANRVLIANEYKKIKSSAEAYISKYNKIFFLDNNVVREGTLDDRDKKFLEIFKDKINQGNIFRVGEEIYEFSQDDILFRDNRDNYYFGKWNEEGQLQTVGTFNSRSAYIIRDQVEVIPNTLTNQFILRGVLYLEGSIELNCNFAFSGIIISNGGRINTNDYEFNLWGKLVEVSENGSFANLENKSIKDEELIFYLEKLEAAKLRSVLNIKINNQIMRWELKNISLVKLMY